MDLRVAGWAWQCVPGVLISVPGPTGDGWVSDATLSLERSRKSDGSLGAGAAVLGAVVVVAAAAAAVVHEVLGWRSSTRARDYWSRRCLDDGHAIPFFLL